MLLHVPLMLSTTISLTNNNMSAPLAPTVEIAPGVKMPMVNLGISNHSLWIAAGGRGIDTAFVYGDDKQVEVGDAVRASGLPRTSLFVTTKVPCCPADAWIKAAGGSPGRCDQLGRNTSAQIEHDMAKLGLAYVDLLLLHWPCDTLDETLIAYRAMEAAVAAGKARAVGLSNFNASMVDQIVAAAEVKPAINQCGFSIAGHTSGAWGRDDATAAACKRHGITFEAYSPLGGWAKGGTGRILSDPTVNAIGKAHNKSSAQVALRWVVQQGIVAVTSSNERDYDEADLSIFDFELNAQEMATLAALV